MHRGAILIITTLAIILIVVGVVYYLINFTNQDKGSLPKTLQRFFPAESPAPVEKEVAYSVGTRKVTSPNNTNNWTYFGSGLYKYSLKYPNNFKIIVGNQNIFQANSKNYMEENGVVINGAITQVIASDTSTNFKQAWEGTEDKLEKLGIKVISLDNNLVDGQEAYKLKLEHPDNTAEIRYLTYKSPYSYKISIVVGKNSTKDKDDYEQILDDIISTFGF